MRVSLYLSCFNEPLLLSLSLLFYFRGWETEPEKEWKVVHGNPSFGIYQPLIDSITSFSTPHLPPRASILLQGF